MAVSASTTGSFVERAGMGGCSEIIISPRCVFRGGAEKTRKENYHFVERSYGTFQHALRLPGPVNPDQVQARFENGVLTVTLPTTEQTERSRRMPVAVTLGPPPARAKSKHNPRLWPERLIPAM